ncbi:hypothetical protein LTR16_005018 [Cryomyces antarcticus]|uniref:BTB domain-containing protein n=1 Tax=Cryomyces antarcticus TaxID=329879 RepID=A0ABR0LMS0_9PEZI|nr:hypothetical protein LTR16_005018 [Cryomyces antarcticus]
MPRLERFKPTNFASSPVTIIVGSAPKEVRSFSLHKELFLAKSDYFRSAFTRPWKEGREHVMELPEDTPDSFQLYCQWLHCGKIVTDKSNGSDEEAEVDLEHQELSDDSDEDEDEDVMVGLDDRQLLEYRSAMEIEISAERGGHIPEEQEDEDEDEEKAVEYRDLSEAIARRRPLVEAYIFGNKIQDVKFTDTVMDELLSRMRTSETSWEDQAAILATTLYPYLPPNCPARHLIIDIVTDGWTKEYLKQFHDKNPRFRNYDLMYDISAELLGDYTERFAGLPYAYSEESSACAYHEHKRLGLPCHRAEEAS